MKCFIRFFSSSLSLLSSDVTKAGKRSAPVQNPTPVARRMMNAQRPDNTTIVMACVVEFQIPIRKLAPKAKTHSVGQMHATRTQGQATLMLLPAHQGLE